MRSQSASAMWRTKISSVSVWRSMFGAQTVMEFEIFVFGFAFDEVEDIVAVTAEAVFGTVL